MQRNRYKERENDSDKQIGMVRNREEQRRTNMKREQKR
jgi:hypothetical protein